MKFLESQEPTKRRKPVMKIKKLFTLALTAALTISLAACSGGASATKMTMGTGGSAGTCSAAFRNRRSICAPMRR